MLCSSKLEILVGIWAILAAFALAVLSYIFYKVATAGYWYQVNDPAVIYEFSLLVFCLAFVTAVSLFVIRRG